MYCISSNSKRKLVHDPDYVQNVHERKKIYLRDTPEI